VTDERKIQSFLSMAGRAAAMAHAASDPWVKREWEEIACAYKDVAQAQRTAMAARADGLRAPRAVGRGKGNG